MNREEVDAFLADCDDVIDDWRGSTDSAAWSAAGDHELLGISGDYYGDDYQLIASCCLVCYLVGGNMAVRFDLMAPLTEQAAAGLDSAERLLGTPLEPWQRNYFLRALAYLTPVRLR